MGRLGRDLARNGPLLHGHPQAQERAARVAGGEEVVLWEEGVGEGEGGVCVRFDGGESFCEVIVMRVGEEVKTGVVLG